MDFLNVALTHTTARAQNKSPFFFSRFNFERMKERGNTSYCFHCGGDWGFTPDKNGAATNCEDDKIVLYKQNSKEAVKIADALEDALLEPHITNSAGYPRRNIDDHMYTEWLTYTAHFEYSAEFAAWAQENGYKVYRYNPMEKHDPVTHAEAVVGGADKYDWVYEWFEKAKLPEDFPYVVSLT